MVKDAETHEEEDRKRKDQTEARNHAESVIYDIEKNLNEFKEHVDQTEAERLREQITELRKTMESADDHQAIKSGADSLQRESLKAFESAYKQKASSNDNDSGSSSTENKEDDTPDADIKK
jgi:molecular chaperone DnaK